MNLVHDIANTNNKSIILYYGIEWRQQPLLIPEVSGGD